jgi:hypothetical protein
MTFSLQKASVRHPIAVILMTLSVFLFPASMVPSWASTEPEMKGVIEKIRMVKLYTVHEGKALNRILDPSVLRRQDQVEVEGYVTGILILADVPMSITVDGQTMSKIRKNSDGTYSIKYFGKVGSSEIGMPTSNNYYEAGVGEEKRTPNFVEGYSLFPKVLGDSVSPACSFRIDVEIGESTFALPVQQTGYSTCHVALLDQVDGEERPVEFQYLGQRLQKHVQGEDFQERLRAISDGIRSVEKAFGAKLVDRVRILDYEKIQNAVTCEEKSDIWFYVNTFLGEPLAELKTISEHEALHILVDQRRLAKDLAIRELFSDLRGYDSLSSERFAVITRGASPPVGPGESVANREFFAFIDEKNFLEGMKGGHSSQNVDEFCTSFLHSLMFLDRLQPNLQRPLRVGEGQPGYSMRPKKRQNILKNYIRTLETLMAAQADDADIDPGTPSFLSECLKQAGSVKL